MAQNYLKIVLVFLCFSSFTANACLNEIEVIPGIYTREYDIYELEKRYISVSELRAFERAHTLSCKLEISCSDVVIARLYLGEYKKALELSTKLVKKFPWKYEVVMTHAAALELNGNPKEALKFVRKGIKIDPESHNGSEWIHVKILESQISGEYLNMLGIDFGNGPEPVAPDSLELRETLAQLNFQLKERFYFMKDRDDVFSSLLHDYADLLYLNNFKTISQKFYKLSADYGYDHPAKRKEYATTARNEYKDPSVSVNLLRHRSYIVQQRRDKLAVLISFGTMITLVLGTALLKRSSSRETTD